jgi:hypothetical protein
MLPKLTTEIPEVAYLMVRDWRLHHLIEEEVHWGTQRVFCEDCAALDFAETATLGPAAL